MKLYGYFRSSAAYRTRIALNLKGLSYEPVSVLLSKEADPRLKDAYRAINPQVRIPSLAISGGDVLMQSLAIIEYLDEVFPEPQLLPADAVERAHVRAVAQIIACDIHPLNNSGTLTYLRDTAGLDESRIDAWYAHWIEVGFRAIEALLRPGPYAFGSQVTIADLCIVPQVYNARRMNVPIDSYPKIIAVDAACGKLPAFQAAIPEIQPDAR